MWYDWMGACNVRMIMWYDWMGTSLTGSWAYAKHVPVTQRACIGDALDMYWLRVGRASSTHLECTGHVPGMHWTWAGHTLDVYCAHTLGMH